MLELCVIGGMGEEASDGQRREALHAAYTRRGFPEEVKSTLTNTPLPGPCPTLIQSSGTAQGETAAHANSYHRLHSLGRVKSRD